MVQAKKQGGPDWTPVRVTPQGVALVSGDWSDDDQLTIWGRMEGSTLEPDITVAIIRLYGRMDAKSVGRINVVD